jgi:hypothetical protein
MADVEFSSMNPYQALQVIIADDPQSLVGLLSKITTPIKIVAIVPYGTRQAAYIMGDIRINKIKSKPKEK